MATVKKTGSKATANATTTKAATVKSAAAGGVSAGGAMAAPSIDMIDDVRRRDFINIAAISFAGVGAAAVVLPVLSTMGASADVLALASIEVDISKVDVGQAIKLSWRKQPVFVRNLTAKEIAEANAVNVSTLRDPQTLAERTKPGKENWLVTMGVCTHLGCVPLGAASGEVRGEFGGYFCPCHGTHYDTAARVRKGPAPLNLEVPEFSFLSDTTLKIG